MEIITQERKEKHDKKTMFVRMGKTLDHKAFCAYLWRQRLLHKFIYAESYLKAKCLVPLCLASDVTQEEEEIFHFVI